MSSVETRERASRKRSLSTKSIHRFCHSGCGEGCAVTLRTVAIDALAQARLLVLAEGWNATCYQILNPGFDLWFSRDRDAVAGYVARSGYWVIGGAPVCSLDRLDAVTRELEEEASRAGCQVCYFGAEARLEALYRDRPDHARILLGAQPFWTPARWCDVFSYRASLRAQLNRARNKGVTVAEWATSKATRDPELKRCLEEWLSTRGLPPLHFLVEPETLRRLEDRRVFVAHRAGAVIGFLVASPVPQRNGWLVEQIVRGGGAVNGTAELMLDHAVRAFAAEGAAYLTLGLAPLAERAGTERANPLWLRAVLHSLRLHGRRFYNFVGLENFKSKFEPDGWEPVFAIVNQPRVTPRVLWAITAAFANRSPLALAPAAFRQVVRKELGRRRRGVS